MKGLIIKDIINILRNLKIIAGLMVFYSILALTSDNPNSFIGLFSMLFAMYTLWTYSYDEMARWDSYALTMPLTKENIVQGKYILMLLLSLLAFVVNTIIGIVYGLGKQESLFTNMKLNAIGAGGIIFLFSILIPFITKYGVEKARIIIILVILIPFTFGSMILKKIKEIYPVPPVKLVSLVETIVENANIIIPLILIVCLCISYSITIRIYQKKEF